MASTNYIYEKPNSLILSQRYVSLSVNWEFSRNKLQDLSSALRNELGNVDATIAVAGSLGRLEASGQSDADYILITDQKADKNIRERIDTVIRNCGLVPPNPDGVFSKTSTSADLTDGIGEFDDDLGRLGRRLLMLLESRPVYNERMYTQCVDDIYSKYSQSVLQETHKQFVFLLNDLIRYFRAICVNYQSTFWRQNEKWPIRNIKLRHSRVIMYAGLLFLIGAASKYGRSDRYKWVQSKLYLTPLDRIAAAYEDASDDGFFRVAGSYEIFLSHLSNENMRKELNSIEYASRYESPIFSQLKANSDALISELVRFIFSQKGKWSDRFFEYLIF